VAIKKTVNFRRKKHKSWAEHHCKLYQVYFPDLNFSPIQQPLGINFEMWERSHDTRKAMKRVGSKTVLTVYRWRLNQQDCCDLDLIMNKLKKKIKEKPEIEEDRRSLFNGVIHHGFHLYQNVVRLWKSTDQNFIEALRPFIYEIMACAQNGLEEEYLTAMSIPRIHRIGNTPFTGVASNFYDPSIPGFPTSSAIHIDGNDIFCVIVPTGDWPIDQGILGFPQLNLLVNLRPGDVIIFNSSQLYHLVSQISSGYRNSVIFFTHKSLLKQRTVIGDLEWIYKI